MAASRIPVPIFPIPGVHYDPRNESDFRRTVERAIQEVGRFSASLEGLVPHASTHHVGGGDEIDHGSISGLGDDDHLQYHTDFRALTWLGTRSTTDLPEGGNLYYTDERVDDRVAALIVDSASVTWSYNDPAGTLTATVAAAGVDHGSLSGLADDDHTQYLRVDGTRASTGQQDFTAGLTSAGGASEPITGLTHDVQFNDAVLVAGGQLTISSTAPEMNWYETDAGADEKQWDLIVTTGQQRWRLVNDANSSATNWLRIDRTGITLDKITFGDPTNATNLAGATHLVFVDTGLQVDDFLTVAGLAPEINFWETDAALNEKQWDFNVSAGVFALRVVNDANSVANTVFSVERTATTVDKFIVGGSLLEISSGNLHLLEGDILVDQILEDTAGAGVTIDGVLLKDGDVTVGSSRVVTSSGGNLFVRAGGGDVLVDQDTLRVQGGDLLVERTGDATAAKMLFRRDAGQPADINFQTASTNRWILRGANQTAESGSDAGSDFDLYTYNDAGTFLRTALRITRSTGQWTVNTGTGNFDLNGSLAVDTIDEFTAAAGVTIEGVVNKDDEVLRTVNTDELRLIGGNGSTSGANISLYGGAHATVSNDIFFRANGATTLQYDHSATKWVFADGATMEIDTINEATAAAGVTLDGVLLKDSGFLAKDASTIEEIPGQIALNLENPNTPADNSFEDSPRLRFTGVDDSDAGAPIVRREQFGEIYLDMTAVAAGRMRVNVLGSQVAEFLSDQSTNFLGSLQWGGGQVLTSSDVLFTASGTPLDNQVAVWVDENTLEGDSDFQWNGLILTLGAADSDSGVKIFAGATQNPIEIVEGSTVNQYIEWSGVSTPSVLIGWKASDGILIDNPNATFDKITLQNDTGSLVLDEGVWTLANSLNVDTIDEKTTSAGVTIDGAVLKDAGATFTNAVTIDRTSGTTSLLLPVDDATSGVTTRDSSRIVLQGSYWDTGAGPASVTEQAILEIDMTNNGSLTFEGHVQITFNTAEWEFHQDGSFRLGGNIDMRATTAAKILTDSHLAIADTILGQWDGEWATDTAVARIEMRSGADTTNKDEGRIYFYTAAPGGTLTQALKIDENQNVDAANGRISDSETDQVYAEARLGADQSITNATFTGINWSGEVDDGGNMDLTNDHYVAPVDGLYLLVCNVRWESNSTGRRILRVVVDDGGGFDQRGRVGQAATSGDQTWQQIVHLQELSAGDKIKVQVFQDSGGTISLQSGTVNGWRQTVMYISLIPMAIST